MLSAIYSILVILLILAFIVVGTWLQLMLSKSANKWLGLIIPAFCFLFSLMVILSMAMYKNTVVISVKENFTNYQINTETTLINSGKNNFLTVLATISPVFFIANIPTVIFLAIYFVTRERIKIHTELEKMNIQDLE